MKHTKNYIKTVLSCLILASSVCSCIEDSDTVQTPECAITSFAIADIKTTIHTLGYDGSDSTYTRTLSGDDVSFNIDQINGRIYNIDSLPNWVDITHVIPTISTYGSVYAKLASDSLYYYVTSGSDSIDFTNPVEMLSVASDGTGYKKYIVTVSKAISDADSLIWMLADSTLSLTGEFKILARNDTIQLFQENDDVEFRSIQAFNNQFVGIGADGSVKTSLDGISWTTTELSRIKSLMATDSYYLYGFDGSMFLSTGDFLTWTKSGDSNISYVPQKNVSAVYYSSKSNSYQKNVVLVGQTPEDTTHSVVWYKLSSAVDLVNQDWSYIKITDDNDYALPYFSSMSNAFVYNGAINIIGDGYLYISHDNGITWKRQENYLMVPAGFDPALPTQCVVSNEYLYLVQSGDGTRSGKIWKGYINKLKPSK